MNIVFITGTQDSANQGVAVLEIAGVKKYAKLLSDYSVEYDGVKVWRNGLGVQVKDAKQLSQIVLAVQVCLVVKEHM